MYFHSRGTAKSSLSVMFATVPKSQTTTGDANDGREHHGQSGEEVGLQTGNRFRFHGASLFGAWRRLK